MTTALTIHSSNPLLLPLELVDRVFEELTDSTGTRDTAALLACSLTCKTYNGFAESHLYRDITIASSIDGYRDLLPKAVIPVERMAAMLTSRPYLAGLVRSLGLYLHGSDNDSSTVPHLIGQESIAAPWDMDMSNDTARYRQGAFIDVLNKLGGHRLTDLSIHSTVSEHPIHCFRQLSHSFAHALASLDGRSNIRTLVLERISAFPINSLPGIENLTLTHSSTDTLLWPKYGSNIDITPTLYLKQLTLKTRGIHSLYPLLESDGPQLPDRTIKADISTLESLNINFIGFEHHGAGDPMVQYSRKEQAMMYMRIWSIISSKARGLRNVELSFLHERRYTPVMHFIQHHLSGILESRDKLNPLQHLTIRLDGISAPVGFEVWYDVFRGMTDAARVTEEPSRVESLHLHLVISDQDDSLSTKDSTLEKWLCHDIKKMSGMLGDKSLFASLVDVSMEIVVVRQDWNKENISTLEEVVQCLCVFESVFSRYLAAGNVGFGLRVIAR